jgi:peroxiredoxin
MSPFVDRRRFGRRLLGCAGPLVLGLAGAGCSPRGAAPAVAPDVGYTLLDGRPGRLSDLRDQVVLVNFWATSCAVCVAEMPALVDTWRRFRGRGFETLAVAMRYDPPALVARFAETRGLPFGVVIDHTGAVARAFGDVQATPTTFVLDRRGRVAARYEGAPDFAKLHRLLDGLLAAPA